MANGNALEPGTMLRQYRIDRMIGQGGFGITYLAYDADLQRRVAVKECFPRDFVSREGTTVVPTGSNEKQSFSWALGKFVSEATTLARFKHPGIVQVLQIIKEENQSAYMILEFVEGVSLDEWLRSIGDELTEEKLKLVIEPILDALEVVHKNGIAHLDIAPDNIYIRKNGDAVLLDFGAAKQTVGQQTRTLNLVVKDGYSAPEQYYAEGRQGPWSDVYAFAATLYRSLAGKRPVDAMARLDALTNDEPDPLPPLASLELKNFSADFLKAIQLGMSPQSKARPQSISEWRKILLDIAGSKALQTPSKATNKFNTNNAVANNAANINSANVKPQKRKKSKTSTKVGLTAALLTMAIVGVGGYFYSQQLNKQVEDAAWQEASSFDRASLYQEFMSEYPSSDKLPEARKAIANLGKPWTIRINNSANERANSIAVGDEHIVIAGTESVDGSNTDQAFIQSISLSGRVIWRTLYGSTENEVFHGVSVTAAGDIFAVGSSRPVGAKTTKAIIVKFSSSGDEIWSKEFGTTGVNEFFDVSKLATGGLIAVGTAPNEGSQDGWILKFNQNGVVLSEQKFGNMGSEVLTSVAEMNDGRLAVAGRKQKPGTSSSNFWFAKLAPDGRVLLDRSPGGPQVDQFKNLVATNDGELILVGDTSSFGTDSVDGMIMRLTADNKSPPKMIGEKGDDYLTDVKLTPDGGIVIAGYTSSEGAGKTDARVIKYSSSLGEIVWKSVLGNSGWETVEALDVLSDGSVVAAGSSENTKDDGSDVWVTRIGSRGQFDGS